MNYQIENKKTTPRPFLMATLIALLLLCSAAGILTTKPVEAAAADEFFLITEVTKSDTQAIEIPKNATHFSAHLTAAFEGEDDDNPDADYSYLTLSLNSEALCEIRGFGEIVSKSFEIAKIPSSSNNTFYIYIKENPYNAVSGITVKISFYRLGIFSDGEESNPVDVSIIPSPALSLSGFIVSIDNYFSGGDLSGLNLSTQFTFWAETAPAAKYTYENITSSVFDLRTVQRDHNLAGKYFFQAFNKDVGGDKSDPSDTVSVTFLRLDTPDISLTPSGLIWASVSFADEYIVTFTPMEGQAESGISVVTNDTYIDLAEHLTKDIYFGIWELKVVARSLNPDYYQSSEVAIEVKIVKLGTPVLSKTEPTVLTWTEVAGAAFYKVFYGSGSYFTISANTIDVARIGLSGGKYSFTVAACANGVQVPAPDGEIYMGASTTSAAVTTGASYWLVQAGCTVVFGNTDLGEHYYEYGDIVEIPDPVQKGYRFDGWYTDKALTKKYTSNFFTGDTVLYAKFIPLTFGEKIGIFWDAVKWYVVVIAAVGLVVAGLVIKKKRGA